jgi:hypothetical protein
MKYFRQMIAFGLKIGWPGMADTTNVAGSRVLDRNWLH